MGGGSPDQVLTDERLDDLERFRDVDFKEWKQDIERRWNEAFPGGDHAGHRRYHDLMIEQIHDRKRLITAIKEKTISGLVWAVIVFLGFAILAYLKTVFVKGA